MVLNDKNEVLVIKEQDKTYGQKWKLPGGLVEGGEDFGEACEREVWEETGVSRRGGRGVRSGGGELESAFDLPGRVYVVRFFQPHLSNYSALCIWTTRFRLISIQLFESLTSFSSCVNDYYRCQGSSQISVHRVFAALAHPAHRYMQLLWPCRLVI